MKKYIVVRKNDLFSGIEDSFDTIEDAITLRDLKARNVSKLACGMPMWEYYVFQMYE